MGRELFKFVRAVSTSVGIVTFSKAVKLGMLNCGTVMLPKGLILLIAPMAVEMAVLGLESINFWHV